MQTTKTDLQFPFTKEGSLIAVIYEIKISATPFRYSCLWLFGRREEYDYTPTNTSGEAYSVLPSHPSRRLCTHSNAYTHVYTAWPKLYSPILLNLPQARRLI